MTISGFKNFRAALLYLTATLLTLFSIGCNDRGPTVHRKEVHNIHFKGKIYIYRWEKLKDKTTRVNVGIPQPDGRVEYTDDKTLEDEIQILAQQVLNGDSNNGTVTVNN